MIRSAPDFVHCYIDLAQPRLGAQVLSASDEFFARKERLIKPQAPVFIADKYDDHGKWMDGWETRRRREAGHDFCVVKICAGTVSGLDIDTTHFTGNYPSHASVDACSGPADPDADTDWKPLLSKVELQGDSHNYFSIGSDAAWTHLRLNIYPDGGVARLRVYGQAHCDWSAGNPPDQVADLAAMSNGGRVLACNDMHYGHMSNLIAPGRGVNMGDGWETRRRRGPGHDWVILKLGHRGLVQSVEVDTAFFKGNYPHHCSLHGANLDRDADIDAGAPYWLEILPQGLLGPDRVHRFDVSGNPAGPVSHIRFNIYPDGGVSRLRLYGLPDYS